MRAVGGERAAYRPVRSALCAGSDPVAVARALVAETGSAILYLADLDAILGGPPQADVLAAILAALPKMTLWVDGGFRSAGAFPALADGLGPAAARLRPVFGSESLPDPATARACLADRERAILSLDRRGGQRLDPAGCWDNPALWPRRVIVMTLERVGALAGPDLELLAEVRRRAPQAALIGAGGIRDQADIDAAARAGARAWLVASALHDRRLLPGTPPVDLDPPLAPGISSLK